MTLIRPILTLSLGLCVLGCISAPARGQEEAPPAQALPATPPESTQRQPTPEAPQPGELSFSVTGGYRMQFTADFDDGGDIGINSTFFGVSMSMPVSSDLKVDLSYRYIFDDYDFGGSSGFGALDPWSNVTTQNITLTLSITLTNDLILFLGPDFDSEVDSGGQYDRSTTYGGFAGLTYVGNPKFITGLGMHVESVLEGERVRVTPIVILNWTFTPELRLASRNTALGTDIDLIYSISPQLDLSLGAGYRYRRFRLDDDGYAPGGVGQTSGIPVYARATYHFSRDLSIEVMGGVVMSGEAVVDDSQGTRLAVDDYDAALFVTARLSFSF